MVVVNRSDQEAEFVLIGGQPHGEPIVQYGPVRPLVTIVVYRCAITTACRLVCDEHAEGDHASLWGLPRRQEWIREGW